MKLGAFLAIVILSAALYGAESVHVVIMHTNDLHGHVLPGPGSGGSAALATVVPIVRDTLRVEDLPTGSPSLRALRFRLHGDNQVIALWNTSQSGLIGVHVMGSVPLQVRSIEPESSDDATAPNAKDRTIQISDMPVLVSGASLALKSVN